MTLHGDTTAKTRLLDAAARLFYAEGITATGITAITNAAGVAKMSLYNNFSSKEDLALAYIEKRYEEWLGFYSTRLGHATDPKASVLAVFDAYIDHARLDYEHGFRGCGLLNAAAELPADSPGRKAVRRHKEHVETILTEHLKTIATPEQAAQIAEHCSFLLEGAVVRAGLEGQSTLLHHARQIAANLIDAL